MLNSSGLCGCPLAGTSLEGVAAEVTGLLLYVFGVEHPDSWPARAIGSQAGGDLQLSESAVSLLVQAVRGIGNHVVQAKHSVLYV